MGSLRCHCYEHPRPLKSTKISSKCDACYEDHHENNEGYKCEFCEFCIHKECINVNIPSRHKHPLKLIQARGNQCCLCHTYQNIAYRCSQYCSFYICVPCARKPLIFYELKAHEHELLQLVIQVSFTCYACGLYIRREYPCFCLHCCFVIHRACISLPRVIYINCHDHRISHVSSLGPGKWICGICYEHINGAYGAYSCSVCSYVSHSKCSTSEILWDGRELEGMPEEDEKEEKPFRVIDQNLIKHSLHHHILKSSLSSSRVEYPREHCHACAIPLYSELCYKCIRCDFILHDSCANLPLKKRHEISKQKLTLRDQYSFTCRVCQRICRGFSYFADYDQVYLTIDVRCALISGAIKHESHPHWLFVTCDFRRGFLKCDICDLAVHGIYLRCTNKDNCGGYKLCFACATLPMVVRHIYDDHPLSLYYGEKNLNVTYCCGICEEDIYSKSWLYKCDACSSTLHTQCVFDLHEIL